MVIEPVPVILPASHLMYLWREVKLVNSEMGENKVRCLNISIFALR